MQKFHATELKEPTHDMAISHDACVGWRLCRDDRLPVSAVARTMPRQPAVKDDVARPSSIQYVPLDAPAGMSQAVIVQRMPLVHTRQLFAVGSRRKAGGRGFGRSADRAGSGQPGGRAEGFRVGPGQTHSAERLRPFNGNRQQLPRTLEQAARPVRSSGDHLGPDAVARIARRWWPSMRSPGPPTAARRWR